MHLTDLAAKIWNKKYVHYFMAAFLDFVNLLPIRDLQKCNPTFSSSY